MILKMSFCSFAFRFLGGRQLVVYSSGQPFWGKVASAQTHSCGLFPDGCGGLSHWHDTLLHGAVNVSKHVMLDKISQTMMMMMFTSNCDTLGFHSYTYDTVIQGFQNDSVNIAACADPEKTLGVPEIQMEPSVENRKGKNTFFLSTIVKVYIHLVQPSVSALGNSN